MTPSPRLPRDLLSVPISHRGYHNRRKGLPENSLGAATAAMEAGYGIELDLQLSADGVAMVFHDAQLDRLTNEVGLVREKTAAELGKILLRESLEHIPTLSEYLDLVNGRAPLLIEMKDQTGVWGLGATDLEEATIKCLDAYKGTVAVMSFNPHCVAAFGTLAPNIPRGLVTEDFLAGDTAGVSQETLRDLTHMTDLAKVGASFISHDHSNLHAAPVADARAKGMDVLCWTVRSKAQEAAARHYAQNVTFEGYPAKVQPT